MSAAKAGRPAAGEPSPEATTGAAPRRGRGRPPRLSHEQIIEAAVGLVRADPATPLTVKRVAEAVGSAPMALYRYFPERDDLLHAVADRVLNALTFEPPKGATWQDQIRAWMRSSLEHLRPYPQLLPYIAATTQAAWLPSFLVLMDVLEPLGLPDEELALTVTVIGSTIVGQALLEARRRSPGEAVAGMRERLAAEPRELAERVEAVLAHVPQAYGRAFDVIIDGVVAGIEARAGGPGTSPPDTRRPPRTALTPLFSNREQY